MENLKISSTINRQLNMKVSQPGRIRIWFHGKTCQHLVFLHLTHLKLSSLSAVLYFFHLSGIMTSSVKEAELALPLAKHYNKDTLFCFILASEYDGARRLCSKAQSRPCNPCSFVLNSMVNIVSRGLVLKSFTCRFNVNFNEKKWERPTRTNK